MPDSDGSDRTLFTSGQVRMAFNLTVVVMIGTLVVLLLMVSFQPQAQFQAADDGLYRAHVMSAAEALEGYELVGETRARIDIRHAIDLVAERGVDL
ncbi:MAG: hypothetical protein WD336_05095, partial [Trueperaceae bacterium]